MSGFEETIEKLKVEIGINVAELKQQPQWGQIEKLYVALGTIEDLASQPRTPLVELFGIASAGGYATHVKQGEFYGLEPSDAAKKYLKRKGEAAHLDEIIEAIEKGGVKANKKDLRISLSRSTWDIAKVGEDLYGLLEFYPHVKRGKKKSGQTDEPENATEAVSSTVENGDQK